MQCKFTWKATYWLPPPSKKAISVKQVCMREKGHAGNHRSLSNVIKERGALDDSSNN